MPRRGASAVSRTRLPVALSIAGSDSGAGAGIQADLLTFAALGVYGTTAITCLTAQNPAQVKGVHPAPAGFVREQIAAVHSFFGPGAIKTGMLFNASIIEEVAQFLGGHRSIPVVVDPVMVSSSGAKLLREDATNALVTHLFPLAKLITPNIDECAALIGSRPKTPDEMVDAALMLARRFGTRVLLKGGHLPGGRLTDILAMPRGTCRVFTGHRIANVDTHGSGCTLSAAIAALLARGSSVEESIAGARRYLRRGMRRPLTLAGRRFIAH